MKEQFIPSLTPLRGIAAVLVVLFHSHIIIAPLMAPGEVSFFSKLYLMVDFFFVLSGFIMFHVYGNMFTKKVTQAAFTKFIIARFARIYPLHLFMLFGAIALYAWLLAIKFPMEGIWGKMFDPLAIPANLTLLHAVFGFNEATWNTPSWSISVEWIAYLCFPFILKFLVNGSAIRKWVLLGLVIAGYLSIIYYFQPALLTKRMEWLGKIPGFIPHWNTIDVITGPALLRCLSSFILGLLSYHLYSLQWKKNLLSNGYIFVASWIFLSVGWHFDWLSDLIAPFVFSLIILCSAHNNGKLSALLNIRPLRYIGNISFSIYMVHMPLILGFVVARITGMLTIKQTGIAISWVLALLLLLVTLLLASLTYFGIEKPARKWLKKKISDSRWRWAN